LRIVLAKLKEIKGRIKNEKQNLNRRRSCSIIVVQ
jgi:hypothetical protein